MAQSISLNTSNNLGEDTHLQSLKFYLQMPSQPYIYKTLPLYRMFQVIWLQYNKVISSKISCVITPLKFLLMAVQLGIYLKSLVNFMYATQLLYALLSVFGIFTLQLLLCSILILVNRYKHSDIPYSRYKTFIAYLEVVKYCAIISSIAYLANYYDANKNCLADIMWAAIISSFFIIVELIFIISMIFLLMVFGITVSVESAIHCIRMRFNNTSVFPMRVYKYRKEWGEKMCIICLTDIEEMELISRLQCKCDTYYHNVCILEWWKAHQTCPVCRASCNID